MPPPADYYAVLGVGRDADILRIRQAYRRLARRLHPDLNPNDRVVEERFRQIQRAFEILGDPDRRAEYDRHGGAEPAPARVQRVHYGFAGFDFGEEPAKEEWALHEIFGGSEGSESAPTDADPDIHARERISFIESLEGKQVRLRVNRREICGPCGGRGERPVGQAAPQGIECAACAGAGRRLRRYGHMVFSRPCRRCGGQGTLFHTACSSCGGRGSRIRSVRVVARVPAGVSDGATVVVDGQGHERLPGEPAGDLRLHIEVTPHPVIERHGDNLVCPLPLTLAEATLGGRIEVPTLSGNVAVRLPPGVQPGTRLRLAGRGVPSIRGDGRGDLFLEVRIHIPEIRDDRSRDLVRELEERYPESPRDALREKLRQ
ncbi:MAG: J domain-containing protein [Acidobacteriota bacterium]|nr:J domain-containing protein [Acidobacteriota bacterium]MDE2972944.1 J domain-containing protein [Acidobacteriota bacterium]MDE3262062.1 J domain-containing protein [Acidobacteriota bacterium]